MNRQVIESVGINEFLHIHVFERTTTTIDRSIERCKEHGTPIPVQTYPWRKELDKDGLSGSVLIDIVSRQLQDFPRHNLRADLGGEECEKEGC